MPRAHGIIVDRASRTQRTENTWPSQGTDYNLVWLGPKKLGVEGLMLLDKEAELLHEERTVGKAEAPLSPLSASLLSVPSLT